MKYNTLNIIFFLLFLSGISHAQATFEIKTDDKGNGEIGVYLRETSGTTPSSSDYYADITFGIKWSKSYGVDLLAISSTSYNLAKSGTKKTSGDFDYQAFGLSPAVSFALFPSSWTQNTWVEIMSIKNTQVGSGCGAFEIAEKGFALETDPNFNVNLTDYEPSIAGSAACVALPIELATFSAEAVDDQALLKWTTASEQNSAYFAVQGRTAESTWTILDEIAAAGESVEQKNYAYIDRNPYIGYNYYRLKMVDRDGTFEYSDIRALRFDRQGEVLSLYPNPVTSAQTIKVALPNTSNSTPTFSLIDTQGRNHPLVTTPLIDHRQYKISLPDLAPGYYFVQITTDAETFNEKVLIH